MPGSKDTSSLISQRKIRLEKASKLRQKGINPYPSKSERSIYIDDLIKHFDEFERKRFTIVGRLVSFRHHGKLAFGHIQDVSGRMQLYFKNDILKSPSELAFEDLELIDVGDILQGTGVLTKTKRGEISLLVEDLKILSKSIRPLPDKWKGIVDEEMLVRRRYLDFIMHPEKKEVFNKISEILFYIREFFHKEGFIEVNTPIVQPLYGGGNAKPFKTHVNALDRDFYLAISHELYLKRLIVAGFEKVYGLNKIFRNEGIDKTHNPEFTMLETMTAFENYEYNMQLIERMFEYITKNAFGRTEFELNGVKIDFGKPWKRISMVEAVRQKTGIDFRKFTKLEDAQNAVRDLGIKEDIPNSIGECLYKVQEELVEKSLIQPTFLMNHPVEISPLAKRMESDDRFVERFEIFINGIEHGDNWTELNDPVELFERFSDQVKRGRGGDDEAHPMDLDFIEAIEYGMAPTTGIGPGIERLLMTLLNKPRIDDVIFFPMIKPRPITKRDVEIYGKENIYGKESSSTYDEYFADKKFVVVLKDGLEKWKVSNSVGHIAVKLASSQGFAKNLSPKFFTLADGETIPQNFPIPVVALKASEAQLHNLAAKIKETITDNSVKFLIFTQDMIDAHATSEASRLLQSKNIEDLDIVGIGLLGDSKIINKLTKKFSLFG